VTVDMADPGLDVLDLWSAPAPMAGTVAFDASPKTSAAQPPAWRLDLPAGRGLAEDRLALAEASLDGLERTLDQSGPRLRRLTAREVMADGAAFDAAASPDLPAAEAELLAALQGTDRDAGIPSFGVMDQLRLPSWEEAGATAERLLRQAERLVAHYAWIETAVEGRLIGQTTVTWTGDLRTVWPAGTGAEEQRLHERSVRLALATRAATVRIIAVVTAGAVTIVPLLTTPGSAILALPAIWKFIGRIRSELERPNQPLQEH